MKPGWLLVAGAALFVSLAGLAEVKAAAEDKPKPPGAAPAAEAVKVPPTILKTADGKYEISIDTAQAPELKEWAEKKLGPVMLKWYPMLVEMLPSEGYEAPAKFSVIFQNPGRGVAATAGTRVTCAVPWFKKNLEGEAIGAVVHELVHVVQQYGLARRYNPNATRSPGWLVEGIPDYIRWFKYEPQSHGADRIRNPANVKYDGSYRISANFLNYVVEKYDKDKDLIKKANAAMRQGKYSPDLWKQYTGKTADELGEEWKASLQAKPPGEAKPKAAANAGQPAAGGR